MTFWRKTCFTSDPTLVGVATQRTAKMTIPSFRIATTMLVAALLLPVLAQAQYFGKNKPRYERFDWRTYQTPNFNIYNYLEPASGGTAPERLEWIGVLSEDWYARHQRVFGDSIMGRNLMLLYNNHADFQQTNAISGSIGSGTGGVTEAFKNRVIYPFAMSNHQTDHVLGHELVHAFQYNLILNGDSTNIKNLANLPLWMVEGLAEYLSIGRVDAHTSMWMRDAVLNDDVPTIKKLNNPQYFPYRWGQAWWSFVTGLHGDQVIRPLFEETAKRGLELAVKQVLDISLENLDKLWVDGIKGHYQPFIDEQTGAVPPGKLLIDDKAGGELNIAPQVSPDGRYVIFLSEKNLFSIDLFLADARNGKIIRQITKKTRAGHIDDFAYIESAGTWAPKSDKFAFVGVSKGRNILLVNDVDRGKTIAEYDIPGLEAFDNPTWSPDGESIVVSGLVQGQVDLYQFFLDTEEVVQLTNDFASELLPSWNGEGTQLVYGRDHLEGDSQRLNASTGFDIAILDVPTGRVEVLDVFAKADNLNPAFDHEGDIIFLSNYDGYRDMYRYDVEDDQVYRMTDLKTGVSGITAYAPAISVSPRRDRIAYTYLNDGKYSIYSGQRDRFLNELVEDTTVDLAAAKLPSFNKKAPLIVDAGLAARTTDFSILGTTGTSTTNADSIPVSGSGSTTSLGASNNYGYVETTNPFKLDYVGGGAGVGTSIGNPGLGTQFGATGGVNALFSDVLGNQQVFTGISLNGQIYDLAAQLAYINREHTLGWGVSYSHVPYRSGAFAPQGQIDTVPGTNFQAIRYDLFERRIFEDRLGAFVDYPFSRTLRAEAGASYAFYNQRLDRTALYYDRFGNLVFQDRNRDRENELPSLNLGSVSTALVGDNAIMGLASPLQGYRFRLGVEQFFGDYDHLQSTVDVRGYQRFAPVTFALRGMHYGRHGFDEQDGLLYPFYVGSQFFVRGLNNQGDLYALGAANGFNLNALVGNNIGVVNAEVRLPFTGPKRLALINFPYLYTELTAFVDAGLAYDDFADVRRYYDERDAFDNGDGQQPPSADFASLSRPIVTGGLSLRANVLGAIILEPYYARVLNMEGSSWKFGLNIVPGW